MAKLRVTIIDEVKNRRLKVDLPDDTAMEKLLPALAKKLGLPPAAYQLTHEATGRALGGDQTLASFGVKEGDALRLAAAREEAPVVPWLAGEEAVPIWQKVPVWGWVGIVVLLLLAVAVMAFLAGREATPTPTVIAEVTTPTATSTAMPRPTDTPVAPTFTLLPPAVTPVPPTATPVPTSTPRPTDTPVPPTDTPVPPTDTPVPPQPTDTQVPATEPAPALSDPWGLVTISPGGQVNIALVGDTEVFPQLTVSMQGVVQMAIDEAGPVQGFPLGLIVVDGGCGDSQAAIEAASKVVADSTVAGVVGHLCSPSCVASSDVYEGAHIVMVSPSCTFPEVTERGLQVVNRVCTRDDRGGDDVNAAVMETSAYREFVGRYSSRYGSSLAGESDVAFFAAYAYDAANVIIRAIKQVAVVDGAGNLIIGRQALVNAVRATAGYQGVTGVISFDSKGDRLP